MKNRGKKFTVAQMRELASAGIKDPTNWLFIKYKFYSNDGSKSLKKSDENKGKEMIIINRKTGEECHVKLS